MHYVRIDRTVYRIEDGGERSVMFHLTEGPTTNQLDNADALASSASQSYADLASAISHSVNYNGIDSKLNMPDFEVAKILTLEVQKHLRGVTDVQVIERMSPEDRKSIGAG